MANKEELFSEMVSSFVGMHKKCNRKYKKANLERVLKGLPRNFNKNNCINCYYSRRSQYDYDNKEFTLIARDCSIGKINTTCNSRLKIIE